MAEELSETLDYSKKELKKISKANEHEARTVVTLILDENELQRVDNVDSYSRLENLSVSKNSLLRMYGVGKLTSLRDLNLSNNAILTIEGLKELVYLKKLQLSCNNIKSIEHLNNNVNLEYLDLSDNQISHISDISYLKHLKHLLLDRNRIGNLKQCERYVPSSLLSLGLASNFLTDLNTLCHLSHLGQLENINIEGNPCVTATALEKIDFDYRPFVINWVMSVKSVDGYEVNAIESLKAEWLYSQGRGRQFREGEHALLGQYLATTCPVGAEAPETEEQRKLRLILSKAQHHQQQLREQGPSPPRAKHSPRMHARIAGRMVNKSPDRSMSSSYHSALSNKHHNLLAQNSNAMSASFSGEIPNNVTPKHTPSRSIADMAMSQSFDCSSSAIFNSEPDKSAKEVKVLGDVSVNEKNGETSDVTTVTKDLIENHDEGKGKENVKNIESHFDSNKALNQPLEAASKMVPVPDSLMSPDYQGPLFAPAAGIVLNQNPQTLMANRRISGNTQVYNPNNCQSPLAYSHPGNSTPSSIPTSAAMASIPNPHSEVPVINCSTRTTKVTPQKPAVKTTVAVNPRSNKGSPQLSRSAMSSPKLRHTADQRKGSFSARLSQQNNDEMSQSAKNLYNQTIQSSNASPNNGKVNDTPSKRKQNGTNKIITVLSSQTEIQVTPPDSRGANSSDDDSEMCVEKLQSIRNAANQRRQKQSISESVSSEGASINKGTKSKSAFCAAVTIQKLWRGYRTRNLNCKTGTIMHSIQTMRARQYIEKLSCDMETTKAALDSERKIQQLQMQAINALWKKISAMESSTVKDDKGDSGSKVILSYAEGEEKKDEINSKDNAVRELTQTCSMLQAQVQQLQGSMRDILRYVSARHPGIPEQIDGGGVSTQTEISAVHTPQGESSANWPYHKAASRPCSLSLTVQNNNFKKKNSITEEMKESVQTETKETEASTSTSTEKDQVLPGQVEKVESADATRSSTSPPKDEIGKLEGETITIDDGEFIESLKKDCLGVSEVNECQLKEGS